MKISIFFAQTRYASGFNKATSRFSELPGIQGLVGSNLAFRHHDRGFQLFTNRPVSDEIYNSVRDIGK